MTSWLLLTILAASRESVVFHEPVAVQGRPRPRAQPGPGACSVHFEFFDPTWGWIDYAPGGDVIEGYEHEVGGVAALPDHDSPLFNTDFWCWDVVQKHVRLRGDWRIVDGEEVVLTRFAGPYAVDAGPLAVRLGEERAYRLGRRDPACVSTPDHECWTALELWLYVEDWKDAHCAGADD